MSPPSIAVIIPSLGGARSGNAARLLEGIKAQTLQPVGGARYRAHRSERPCSQRRGSSHIADVLLFLDDDMESGIVASLWRCRHSNTANATLPHVRASRPPTQGKGIGRPEVSQTQQYRQNDADGAARHPVSIPPKDCPCWVV